MKIFSLSSILFFTIVFSYSIIAQEIGSIKRTTNFSIPEKIQGPFGDPLPAGTYTIGSGGDFPTIDSAFNKLSLDGIAGEVTMELTDNLYTAPSDSFGFLLIGPINGAGENSRVIIKPAQNHQVTVEGDGGGVLSFSNTSYVTIDGVALTGSTTFTINSYNDVYDFKFGVHFIDNSDQNIVKNLQVNCEDYTRYSIAIGFSTNVVSAIGSPDNNLIENNKILKACLGIWVSGYNSIVYALNNVIRDNLISAPTGNIIRWGIQLEKNENTIVENNVVENLINSLTNLEAAIGINAHWCNSCVIRNNVVHSVSSDIMNGSTGIMLSGVVGKEGYDNMIYNNMVFDIQSTSTNTSSRVAGIQMWQNHNPKVYYNSIYLSGTGSNYMGSGALYIRTNSTNVEAYDNIFVNTRNELPNCASSIYMWYYPDILTSDYNDLFYEPNANSCLVRATGGDYHSLEEWQSTGHDMHSITEMPNFQAVDDLHIDENIPTNLESGATPIAGIDIDYDGDLRHATTPDIGADEFDGMGIDTLYVPGDYTTIQEAIDAAVDGNIVLVADGTYYENINYNGKAITVASYFLFNGDTSHISNTIIDGSQPSHPDTGSVVIFNSGEDSTSVLYGFTVTGGTGTRSGAFRDGGAIYIYYSSATLQYNIIENNEVINTDWSTGGAIFAYLPIYSHLRIEDNIIRNNMIETTVSGARCLGTVYIAAVSAAMVTVRNNEIYDNQVVSPYHSAGGGLMCFSTNNVLVTCYIENNKIVNNQVMDTPGSSVQWGGGIYLESVNAIVRNNIIAYNSAEDGGGIYYYNDITPPLVTPIIENNTIYGNNASAFAGAINTDREINIQNCIIWGNSSPQYYGGTNAVIEYSTLEENYPTGSNNSYANPEFEDTLDFFLSATSPCIDAGNPDPMYYDVEDSNNVGNALYPAMGTLINDQGVYGGPHSTWATVSSVEEEIIEGAIPDNFLLSQNYPNPFNPSTKIKYSIPQMSNVIVKVFDILGNEIETLVNEEKQTGTYEITWFAEGLPSGVYFYQLRAGDFVETRKMILIK